MRLPQFTAEASLAKTKQHYVLSSGTTASSATVLPQILGVHWVPVHSTVVQVCWSDGICTFETVVLDPLSIGTVGPTHGVVGVTGSGSRTGNNNGFTGRNLT